MVVSIIKVLIRWGCGRQYFRSAKSVGVVVVSIIKVLIRWGCGGQYYKSVN